MIQTLVAVAITLSGAVADEDTKSPRAVVAVETQIAYQDPIPGGYVLAGRSGRVVAVIVSHWPDGGAREPGRVDFYRLSEAGDRWQGNMQWETGNYNAMGTVRWMTDSEGRDVLCETVSPHRAVVVGEHGLDVLAKCPEDVADSASADLAGWKGETLPTPIGPGGLTDSAPDRAASLVCAMIDSLRSKGGEERSLPSDLELHDVALNSDRILYSSGYHTKAYLLDLEGEHCVTLEPGNERPRSECWAYPRFSPSERYVLVEYRYTGDSNDAVPAGVVQLFNAEGQFITEVVEWKPEARGFICGCALWLTGDWIVYTTPYSLVFARIAQHPAAP